MLECPEDSTLAGTEMERTLLMVKPDGVQRGLVGEVIRRLEARGLKPVGLKLIWVSTEQAERLYAVHQGKPFYEGLIRYITSSPVVVSVWEGPNAVEVVRRTIGATNPVQAEPGTIRGDFGLSIGRNIVHASDGPETAAREVAIFFREDELVSFDRVLDRWVLEE
jgi:nucleoside-diphosphate kinase